MLMIELLASQVVAYEKNSALLSAKTKKRLYQIELKRKELKKKLSLTKKKEKNRYTLA